jgi:PEP-CTERM motif
MGRDDALVSNLALTSKGILPMIRERQYHTRHGGSEIMPQRNSVLTLVCGLTIWLGGATTADAASYYTVTNLGQNWSIYPVMGSNGQTYLQNETTNATISFPVLTIPVNQIPINTSKIPQEPGYIGAENPEPTMFSVEVISANLQGNFIGAFPDSGSRADPYATNNLDYSYFAKQPDGSYKSMGLGPLTSLVGFNPQLNAKDQTLSKLGLWNLDTNTILSVNQIIAPDILSQFKYGVSFDALDNDGSILASTSTIYGGPQTYFLLTPPGLPAPTPTPEPSTFVVLAMGLCGLAIRRHRNHQLEGRASE